MNANERILLGLDVRILLIAAACDNVYKRCDNIVTCLDSLIELDVSPIPQHVNVFAEWLPQTRALWPKTNTLQDFIKNIHAEAKATSKVSADLHEKLRIQLDAGYTTNPAFILGSKVAETKSMIYKTYDAVALVYTFGIGIGVGVIFASIFWFSVVR